MADFDCLMLLFQPCSASLPSIRHWTVHCVKFFNMCSVVLESIQYHFTRPSIYKVFYYYHHYQHFTNLFWVIHKQDLRGFILLFLNTHQRLCSYYIITFKMLSFSNVCKIEIYYSSAL